MTDLRDEPLPFDPIDGMEAREKGPMDWLMETGEAVPAPPPFADTVKELIE
jgi:hypothetical protein